MPHISIMSMVGTAVPTALRAKGHLACWYVAVDGLPKSGPFTSLEAAIANRSIWEFESTLRQKAMQALAA
ncbi:hypothetical protein HP532_16370 [Pseudomonas sp. CrR25]|nr:hypothetical protein [Pseudomonas sp. CrR25]